MQDAYFTAQLGFLCSFWLFGLQAKTKHCKQRNRSLHAKMLIVQYPRDPCRADYLFPALVRQEIIEKRRRQVPYCGDWSSYAAVMCIML